MNRRDYRIAFSAFVVGIVFCGVANLSGARADDKEKPKKPDALGLVTCSTSSESRTLAIATKEGGGCELHYEKYGKDKVISWSSVSVDPCVRSQVKVRKELEDAGWKCIQE